MWKGDERRRLYKEAKDFLKLRAARNRAVKDARAQQQQTPDADAKVAEV